MEKTNLYGTVKREANALAIRAKAEAEFVAATLKDTHGDQVTSSGGLAIIAVLVVAAIILWQTGFLKTFTAKLGETIMNMFGS